MEMYRFVKESGPLVLLQNGCYNKASEILRDKKRWGYTDEKKESVS